MCHLISTRQNKKKGFSNLYRLLMTFVFSFSGKGKIQIFATISQVTLGYRAVFTQVSKSNWFALLLYTIGLKTSRHFFILSEVKPKQTETLSHSFSYVSHQLRVITSSFDWFIGFIQLQVQPKLIILL